MPSTGGRTLWWAAHQGAGWASCPLTENGVLRIMSHPAYGGGDRGFTVARLAAALAGFAADSDHQFWPDAISLRDTGRFDLDRVHGGRQLTDHYLLGLALEQGGRLATFDQGIPRCAEQRRSTSACCENLRSGFQDDKESLPVENYPISPIGRQDILGQSRVKSG